MSPPQWHSNRPRPWRVDISRTLGAVVVAVQGELALGTSAALGDVLSDLIDGQGNMLVVVDLRAAVVAETDALDVLVAARRSLEDRGGRFLLAAPSPAIGQALVAAGLADAVELHPQRRHHPTVVNGPRTPHVVESGGSFGP